MLSSCYEISEYELDRTDPCFFKVDTTDEYYNVSYEITNRCNLECRHCFNNSKNDAHVGLSKDELFFLIDELSKNKVKNIYMTGGEPTCYPYFTDAIKYLYQKNIEVILATNGYYILDYLEDIKKYCSAKAGIYISIDGIGEVHNSLRGRTDAYKCTMESIEMLIQNGLIVRVSSIVWENNYAQIDSMAEQLKNIGVSQLNLTMPVKSGRASSSNIELDISYSHVVKKVEQIKQRLQSEDFKIVLKRDKSLSSGSFECQGGSKILHIDSQGVVYPCSWIAKAKLYNHAMQWKPGNLTECLDKVKQFNKVVDERRAKFGYAGCAAIAQIYNNNVMDEDPLNKMLN